MDRRPFTHRSLSVVVDSTFVLALRLLLLPLSQHRHPDTLSLSFAFPLGVTRVSPQALGAGSSGQPSPLLPDDLCLHRGGGEAAGSRVDPQPREAAGAHPGNAYCLCALLLAHSPTRAHMLNVYPSGKHSGGVSEWYGPFYPCLAGIYLMNITLCTVLVRNEVPPV